MHISNIKLKKRTKTCLTGIGANISMIACETYYWYHCRIQNDCPGEYTKALLQSDAEVLGKEFCKAIPLSGASEKITDNQSETKIIVK